jgi:leader peptidase (prepilin peptidase)/N-methyltransferase
MDALCAGVLGLAAGWCVPSVVAYWITPQTFVRTACAIACAILFAAATTLESGEAFAAVALWSLCLSVVDFSCRRLPNVLTLPGAAAVVVAAAWDGCVVAALLGGLLLGLLYAGSHLATRGIGAGDVKLAVPLGALAATNGGAAWVAAALLAPLATAVLALALALPHKGVPRTGLHRTVVPHGPSMCAATLVAWVSFGA